MKIITLPCYNIIVRTGIDEGDSPEAKEARQNGVNADIHAEWPEAEIKEGDISWQDAYRNSLSGIEHLLLFHVNVGVNIADPVYVKGLVEAVEDLRTMYKLGAECYGEAIDELPEEGEVRCGDYTTASNFASRLLLKELTFGHQFNPQTKEHMFRVSPQESEDESSRSGPDSDRGGETTQEESAR